MLLAEMTIEKSASTENSAVPNLLPGNEARPQVYSSAAAKRGSSMASRCIACGSPTLASCI
jgi:hypothetical protein